MPIPASSVNATPRLGVLGRSLLGKALGIDEVEPIMRPRLYKIAHSSQFPQNVPPTHSGSKKAINRDWRRARGMCTALDDIALAVFNDLPNSSIMTILFDLPTAHPVGVLGKSAFPH
jgi:hypothetical protein